jgi:pilus assembly protein Flp/PilA
LHDTGTSMIGLLKKLAGAERGATAVEYGLICALIVLGAMGAITTFGTTVIEMWDDVSTEITNN